MLPADLQRRAEREALALGISLAELIRRRLAGPEPAPATARPRFFARQPWTGAGPDDVAAAHDRYLYGE